MLASLVREIIAPVLRECPRECGMVAITEVQVSSDFSYATILISALMHPESALAFLHRETPRLQRSLSAIARKRIPLLRFRIDPRIERGERLDRALEESDKQSSRDDVGPHDSSRSVQEQLD